MRRILFSIPFLLVSIPLAVAAGTVAVPHDFVDGDPAYASEVNANFDAVESAVNDNDSRIGAAQAAADAAQVRVGDSCPLARRFGRSPPMAR